MVNGLIKDFPQILLTYCILFGYFEAVDFFSKEKCSAIVDLLTKLLTTVSNRKCSY